MQQHGSLGLFKPVLSVLTICAATLGAAGAARAADAGDPSTILDEAGAYGRAIAIARACGMDGERARRTVSTVMVYAYASALPRLADPDVQREFLVRLVERLNRKHAVATPDPGACAHAQQVLTALNLRLDAAVRMAGTDQ